MLVALRKHRPLMPYRRRITIRRQSGGGPLQLLRSSGTRWSSSNRSLVSLVNSVGGRITCSGDRLWPTRTDVPVHTCCQEVLTVAG